MSLLQAGTQIVSRGIIPSYNVRCLLTAPEMRSKAGITKQRNGRQIALPVKFLLGIAIG